MTKVKIVLFFFIGSILAIGLFLYKDRLSTTPGTTSGLTKIGDNNKKSVTYLLIDGLSSSIFNEELKNKKLPHIEALIQKSFYVSHGISSFPTMTGYAFYPFITGVDACESGIYGLRWFDKQRDRGNLRNYVGRTNVQMNRDIAPKIPTIFEKAGQDYTATVNSYMNRGVVDNVKTGYAHTTAKYDGHLWLSKLKHLPLVGKYLSSDHFQHETQVTDIAIEQLARNPKVQWITYPALDAYNHINGTNGNYHALLRHLDNQVGRLMDEIKRLRQDHRALVIVSDHGISDVYHNLDICMQLKENFGLDIIRGKSTVLYSSDLTSSVATLEKNDAFFVINGNLSAYMYFNDKKGDLTWGQKLEAKDLEFYPLKNGKTIDLPREIAKMEGIEMVAYRDKKTVWVVSSEGKANITCDQQSYGYQIVEGRDPINYENNVATACLVGGRMADKNEWLHVSLQTDFPDALHRIYQLVMKEKSGDLTITSKAGFDLAKDYEIIVNNYRGGHGGLRKEIIDVPYIVYLPGHPSRTTTCLRAEELGRMVMDYVFK